MLQRYKGYAMAFFGASLWGISGTVAQMLFSHYGFTSGWLVPVRMFSAWLLLLVFTQIRTRQRVTRVWEQKENWLRLLLFSSIGMLGVQFTYFSCIQVGNAATATLLQFLGPLMVMVYLALRMKRLPTGREAISLVLAFLGVYLLVTNGSNTKLSISALALFWGLLSAVTIAFNTLQPAKMLEKWGSGVIIGWGMLSGSLVLAVFTRPWAQAGTIVWTSASVVGVLFVILFGTLLPFFLFLDSLRLITATEASLLSSAEPLVAMIASVTWLHVPMHLFEVIGAFCIIGTVLLLSFPKRKVAPAKLNHGEQKKEAV